MANISNIKVNGITYSIGGSGGSGSGTITGIKMNGVVKGTSGVVDLGTVVTNVDNKANKSDIPTKVSQLQNDSKFVTAVVIESTGTLKLS